MVSGSSQYHNQHWLLHPKYPYYLLTVMFLVQSLLSGGRAQPAAENDMPPILGLVGLVYVIGSASLSCVCLAGAWPLIIKSARIYGILRLFYHRSPVMSIGVERWVFFFYLTTLTGVIEPLITAAQGKRSQPSEIINTVGPVRTVIRRMAGRSNTSDSFLISGRRVFTGLDLLCILQRSLSISAKHCAADHRLDPENPSKRSQGVEYSISS